MSSLTGSVGSTVVISCVGGFSTVRILKNGRVAQLFTRDGLALIN